jgi:signal transduction histidine kinase
LVQLVTRRSALALYGVLLVLPTLVLGGLLWRQLADDHDAEMAAIPGEAANAARRLSDEMHTHLQALLDNEGRRPFYMYKRSYFPPGTIPLSLVLVPSPLATGRPSDGILAWFTYPRGRRPAQEESEIEIFGGSREQDADWSARRADLVRATSELSKRDSWIPRKGESTLVGSVRVDQLPLAVAAVNASQEPDPACLLTERATLQSLPEENLDVRISSFNIHFHRDADGTPRVVAVRYVNISEDRRFRNMPACFDRLSQGLHATQGFFIDPDWIFAKLPRSLASTILDPSQEFLVGGAGSLQSQSLNSLAPFHPGAVMADILPVQALEFETSSPDDVTFGHMSVVGNTANLDARYHSLTLHYLGVVAMLVLSLGTGLALLLRSVQRDLDAAQRTENFVAAVTHELRTPLSAIRMHGEMLREGWVQDDTKRQEYYRRIVRETDRLETLVERVLEKSRLSTSDATPEPGDVNAVVEGLGPSLIGAGTESPAKDVVFDLSPTLPSAQIVPEGVRSIVTNLVENARKYAPVDLREPAAEPIRVATFAAEGLPTLEVRDRGPGIPREERSRIFDAFYRVGNETTRTAKGTGLGLHLAALHCEGMGAKIQALDREGGGTVFRVTFQPA